MRIYPFTLVMILLLAAPCLVGCDITGGLMSPQYKPRIYSTWKLVLSDEMWIEREKTGELHITDLNHITILEPSDVNELYEHLRKDYNE